MDPISYNWPIHKKKSCPIVSLQVIDCSYHLLCQGFLRIAIISRIRVGVWQVRFPRLFSLWRLMPITGYLCY